MPGGFRRKRARDEQRVRVDGNGLMRSVIGEAGLADEEFAALGLRLDERRGLATLAAAKGQLRRTVQLADQVRGSFEDLVVLGSGDLALGIRALTSALVPAGHGTDTAAPGALQLHVADRLDPEAFAALLARLDLRRTLFNVVSGSGDGLPTMSHFLIVRDRLLRELGAVAYQQHVVITTAAGAGPLRQIVNDEGFRDLSLPSDVADERALLTAAALFPAACAGADVADVVAGAAAMAERCRQQDGGTSPARLLATAMLLAGPRGACVLTPASTALHDLATWIERRWSRHVPTDVPLPDTRPVVLLIAVEQHRQELEIPRAYQDLESVGYLGGQGLGTLAALQDEATEIALWGAGRATIALRCPAISAFVLGQVAYLVEAAAALAQPNATAAEPDAAAGLAYGLAGRPGYEAERAEVQRLAARREARYVV